MIQFEAYIFLNKLWAEKKPPEKGVQVVRSVHTWDLLLQSEHRKKISLLRKMMSLGSLSFPTVHRWLVTLKNGVFFQGNPFQNGLKLG